MAYGIQLGTLGEGGCLDLQRGRLNFACRIGLRNLLEGNDYGCLSWLLSILPSRETLWQVINWLWKLEQRTLLFANLMSFEAACRQL